MAPLHPHNLNFNTQPSSKSYLTELSQGFNYKTAWDETKKMISKLFRRLFSFQFFFGAAKASHGPTCVVNFN